VSPARAASPGGPASGHGASKDSAAPYGVAVFAEHAELLRGSAISPEVAQARGYRSADTRAQLERLGFKLSQRHVPGLVLPTWSPITKAIAGHQLRPDEPRWRDGRPVKYETAAERPVVVDCHPYTWQKLGDPAVPLIITEGIRKADSAISAGLCCVALLGVDMWRAKNDKGGIMALPELDAIAWNGRNVYIAFDSDAMVKVEVHRAMGRLARYLEARSNPPEVAFIYLPSGDGGAKVGLDDFFAAGHSVDELLSFASPELRPLPGDGDGTAHGEPEDTFEDVPEEPGARLLEDVVRFIGHFVAFARPEYLTAATLWAVHTHAVERFDSTPRLAVLSPEKQSGKSRLLEVLELLVPRPLLVANTTPAALFRSVAARQPTVMLDEVDAIFGPRAHDHEDLRALLNAGHRKGATVVRCVGDGANMEVAEFPAFAAVALAGIGDLPDTIADRSVILRMRRRSPDEAVEPFRCRLVEPEGDALRRRLAAWAKRHGDELGEHIPHLPAGLTDRPADVWEPLIIVADVAGGDWPERARQAATALVVEQADSATTLGVRLLEDVRSVFEDTGADRLSSKDLLDGLVALEEAPWGDLRGRPLDSRGLARRLKPYGVESRVVRIGEHTPRGYERSDFEDAWKRYLGEGTVRSSSSSTPQESATSATSATKGASTSGDGVADDGGDSGNVADASATGATSATSSDPLTSDVVDVADVALPGGDGTKTHAPPSGPPQVGPCRVCARATAFRDDHGQWLCRICSSVVVTADGWSV
jgi:hypothetical protein